MHLRNIFLTLLSYAGFVVGFQPYYHHLFSGSTVHGIGVTKKKSFNDITPSCDGQPQNEDINALVNVDYLAELDFLSIVQDLVDILSNALSSTFSFCNSEDPRRLAQDDSTSQPFFLGQVSIDDEETGRFLVLPLLEFYSGRHTLRI